MTNTPNNRRRLFGLGVVATIIVAWVLWPFLFQSHVPAFRDGFHFYWPQSVWLEACQQSGTLFPKWNFNEGLGTSVTGQPTWQLYYPLRCIWFLPGLTLEQRNGLFLAIHLLLAALGTYRTARSLNLNQPSSALAAVTYALCCPVLFQVNNLVYLCSATWIAWAMLPILRIAVGSNQAGEVQRHWTVLTLEILTLGALMTLCGDPHAAVNFVLVILFAAAWRAVGFLRRRRYGNWSRAVQGGGQPPKKLKYSAYVWATSIIALQVVIVGLAVWQSLLTLEWVAVSTRSSAIVETKDSYDPTINKILSEAKNDQSQSRFDFSLSPWNFPSIAMPTWAGHFQPENSRWLQAIPSEGRMWIPSIYPGLFPLLLALSAMFVFWLPDTQASFRNVLSVIAVLSLLAAMGNYSIAWALRSLLQLIHLNDLAQYLPSDDRGSLYGLLASIIPGYDSFRYPAKWSVWFSACLALLAGLGSNGWQSKENTVNQINTSRIAKRMGYLTLAWTISVGATIALARVYREPLESWLCTYPDPLAGYPNFSASLRAVVQGILHPVMILLLSLIAWKLWTNRHRISKWFHLPENDPCHSHGVAWLVVVLTTIDLAVLSPEWLTTIDSQIIFADADARQVKILLKNAGLTRVWANTSRADFGMICQDSEPTMQDSLVLQMQFLQGKLGLLVNADLNVLHASGAIEPQATVSLRRWLQRKDTLQSDQPELDQVLAALAVSHRLVWQPAEAGGKLVWQSVKQVRPLCELVTTNVAGTTKSKVQWRTENVDNLVIEVYVDDHAVLLVRQLNDGHWKIEDAQKLSYQIARAELWVTCQIGPGLHTLTLSRDR